MILIVDIKILRLEFANYKQFSYGLFSCGDEYLFLVVVGSITGLSLFLKIILPIFCTFGYKLMSISQVGNIRNNSL